MLSTPPAFILSQDRTLEKRIYPWTRLTLANLSFITALRFSSEKILIKDFQGCICCSVIKDQNFCSETLRIFNGAFLKFLTRSTECCLCLPRYFTRQVLESKINTSFERSAIDLVVHKSIEAFLMPATLLCYHFKIA